MLIIFAVARVKSSDHTTVSCDAACLVATRKCYAVDTPRFANFCKFFAPSLFSVIAAFILVEMCRWL